MADPRSGVRVAVSVLETGLVHVCVGVLAPVMMGVGVLMLDVLMVVIGVRVRVRDLAVVVFVRMRVLMGVRCGHVRSSPLLRKVLSSLVFYCPQPVVAP
jgi:hypothetical protein